MKRTADSATAQTGATARPGVALGWTLLLIVGQASSVALVNAGPAVRYQHYLAPWRLASDAPMWALAVLVVEVAAVAWGLMRSRAARDAMTSLRGWRLLIVGAVFLLTSATGSPDPVAYATELPLAASLQLLHLCVVVLAAASLPTNTLLRVSAALDRVLGTGGDRVEPGGPDRLAWVLAGLVFVVASLLTIFSYERHPHVPDEVVYLIQAKYLAAGRLTLPLPPVPEAFNLDLITYQSDRWFSPVPPGWPFLLAGAAALGATWFLNPLLGAVNILLCATVLRELYPQRTVRLALLLLAASPWHLFMSMNLMTHTATLAAALGAAAAVGRLRRDPRIRWALLGGVCIGIVGLIRPLEAVPVAVLLGLWSLGARGARVRLLPSMVLTLATIATSLAVLPYNRYLTGSSTTFPIMQYTDATYGVGRNALGFGPDRGLPFSGLDPFPGHGAVDVAVNANFNLFQVNIELLGWATGSMLVVALLLTSGRMRRPDWYMVAVVASVAGIHSFYYFSGGPDFGARYWYLIIVPMIALAARGTVDLARQPASRVGNEARVFVGVSALTAAALAVFVPWRAIDKYHHYRGMQPHIRELPVARAGGIVLVRGKRHPDYASAAVYNPLDLRDSATVYAWDRDVAVRRELVKAYPDRAFWLVDGPTASGDGFVVRAGPLSGAELLARPAPDAP